MSNGKAKGSEEERKICKYLSKWLTGSERPYQFWRTSNSGGTSTVIAENIHMTGDITAITPEARWVTDLFSIEIKCGYPQVDLMDHLKNRKSTEIEDFWKQCNKDAERAHKYPLLVFHRKRFPVVVGFSETLEDMFPWSASLTHRLKCVSLMFQYKDGIEYLPTLYLYNFEEFFDLVTPEELKKLNAKTIN